jgi:hypothetical protein
MIGWLVVWLVGCVDVFFFVRLLNDSLVLWMVGLLVRCLDD